MKIALDVDGVLRNLMASFVNQYNNYNGTKRTLEDLTSYDEAIRWCDGYFPELVRKLEAWDCYKLSAMYPGASDFVWDLVNTPEFEVAYVTWQSTYVSRTHTLEWLQRKGFPTLDVHFCKNKLGVHFDIIVEDKPTTAERALEEGRVSLLMLRPWTRSYKGPAPIAKNFVEARELIVAAKGFTKEN